MIEVVNAENELIQIAAAQCSNKTALEELSLRYYPMIVKLANRFHTVNSIKEELIQAGYEGFLRALKCYDQRERAKLSTYAFPWIVGEMKRVLRCIEREKMNISYDSFELCCMDRLFPVDENGVPAYTSIDLRTAFQALSEKDRMLVYCRYFKEMTQRETAERLHKSQAQISKSEQRILSLLREQMT